MPLLKCFIVCAACLAASCTLFDDAYKDANGYTGDYGELSLKFMDGQTILTGTKAGASIDTNSFILNITDQSGKSLYEGLYGNSPESLTVGPGTYHIRAVSAEFKTPRFDSPQWGDDQYVKVESGQKVNVELLCRQTNSGVVLFTDPNFLECYPDAALLLKNKDGSLMYGYSEKRTAYFNPGKVELVLSRGGLDEVILERTLEAREILKLQIKTAGCGEEEKSGKVKIQVDTTREYVSDTFIIGGASSQKGSNPDNAFTITQAKASIGAKDVWVGAYIVGGDLTNKSVSFEAPFSSSSNLAIGSRASVSSRDKCMSVQLPAGPVREALNLVAHPDLLGKYVLLHGDIESSYFGLPGLKNVDEYSLK